MYPRIDRVTQTLDEAPEYKSRFLRACDLNRKDMRIWR